MKKKLFLWFLATILYYGTAAQATCSGVWGDPILHFNFGQGNASQTAYAPLSAYAPGLVTHTVFQPSGWLSGANTSALVKNASTFGAPPNWIASPDHTGDPYGLLFGLNMPDNIGDTVVEYTMNNLCPGTTLQFSIWLLNLMSPNHPMVLASSPLIQYPNMVMRILDPAGNVLAQSTTGNVATDGFWHEFTVNFVNGANTTVKLQLINNTAGSDAGNDVALDDVSVRPCVPDAGIQPKLDTLLCSSTTMNFSAQISPNVYTTPYYLWQYSVNAGSAWNNIGALSAAGSIPFTFSTAAAPAEYWLRYLVSPQNSLNGNCRAVSDTSVVRIDTVGRPLLTVKDTTLCPDVTIDLSVSALYAQSFSWNTGAVTQQITVSAAGTYIAEVSSLLGCKATDTSHIQYLDLDLLDIGPDTGLCKGMSYTWHAVTDNASAYTWNTGAHTPDLTVTASGTYWVEAAVGDCTLSDTATVMFHDPPDIDLGPDRDICIPGTTILEPAVSDDSTAYLWSNGQQTPTLSHADTGSYWLHVTDDYGCTASDTVLITGIDCSCFFAVPNAFSPNNDGKNDEFNPVRNLACPITNYNLSIYNRWGQRVFQSSNPAYGWNGVYNGKPADVGSYMYYCSFKQGIAKTDRTMKGDLTLIR